MGFAVFLDVDGVLNTRTTVKQTPYGYTGIDDARVEILVNVIEKCGGGKIILSPDWKKIRWKTWRLQVFGFKIETMWLRNIRIYSWPWIKKGKGIIDYLEAHSEIEEFVILDDKLFDFKSYKKLWERVLITKAGGFEPLVFLITNFKLKSQKSK